MFHCCRSFFRIQRIGIKSKRRNLHTIFHAALFDLTDADIIQLIHINMADTCIPSFCFPDRPAGNLQTFNPVFTGEFAEDRKSVVGKECRSRLLILISYLSPFRA